MATISSGSVTVANTRAAEAPSTRAASFSSSGIDCSAPEVIRNMYGNPSQVLTRSTATFAHHRSCSHGTPASPNSSITRLTCPNWSLSSPRQTIAEMNPGTA